ncbi:MAG: hypothetical protein V4485_04525 [Pseudomonadota bacterium]
MSLELSTRFKAEYEKVKTLVFGWQDSTTTVPEPLDSPCDVLDEARAIYRGVGGIDSAVCDPTTLRVDYDALIKVLLVLKTHHANNDELGSCIPNLEYTIAEIIRMTHTESVVSYIGNDVQKPTVYDLCIADYSVQLLLEVFNQEILGDAADQ